MSTPIETVLSTLGDAGVEYLIVGGVAVVLHGHQQRREWIETKGMTVFSLWDPNSPGFAVDLFAEEPFDFSAVRSRAVRASLANTEAIVIGLDDLIEMKRAVGRPRDRDDVTHLEALAKLDAGSRQPTRPCARSSDVLGSHTTIEQQEKILTIGEKVAKAKHDSDGDDGGNDSGGGMP